MVFVGGEGLVLVVGRAVLSKAEGVEGILSGLGGGWEVETITKPSSMGCSALLVL